MLTTYILIVNHRIEYDIEPTHERLVSEGNTTNKNRMKADIIGGQQVVFLEMSGAPTDFSMGDTYKTLQERIDSMLLTI